ncbi:MAG: dephospho-CoA kinase [Bacillaceae bacterium]
MAIVLGLTGSIATGKSTVSSFFMEKGVPVIDADQIARDVVKKGTSTYEQIVQVFGEGILLDNGELNREKLGSIIFHNEQKRLKLNGIVHPAVRLEMLRLKDFYIQNGHAIVVLDIPLLFESKLTELVDKVVVVYVPQTLQLERLQSRNGYTLQDAQARIASQISIEKKKEWADFVIDNTGTLAKTNEQVGKLIDFLENKK